MVQEGTVPQPRLYATRAEQQAAYRQRTKRAQQQVLEQKGLPPTPPIPTMPGKARWRATLEQAHRLLEQVAYEMRQYHDERSEEWQDSEKAQDLIACVETLEELVVQIEDVKNTT